MSSAVLFDLGNTLAAYYHPTEFRPILMEAIGAVRDELSRSGLCQMSQESAVAAAGTEDHDAADYRFMPMIDRLERIFQVALAHDPVWVETVCKRFLGAISASAPAPRLAARGDVLDHRKRLTSRSVPC